MGCSQSKDIDTTTIVEVKGHAEVAEKMKAPAVVDLKATSSGQAALPADARIVFVLGGPGSGKGTQCERMVAKYGYKHLSTGDLLREELASGSELGNKCEALMKNGELVPTETIIELVKNAMIKSGAKDFLIDGFPRALDQATCFESLIKPAERVLFFNCPEEVMEARLLKRGETSGRSDDNAETIRKRFKTFVEQSLPVVSHYKALGKVFDISSVPTPDEVFGEVVKSLEAPVGMVVPSVEGHLPEDLHIVFVLGGPGSGKGTQCERIVAKYGYKHLSAGDLLRDEVKSGSEVGRKCEEIMKEGKLVPVEVPIGLIRNAMITSGAKQFLVDGFPRALDQAYVFQSMIKPAVKVLAFDCPEAVMEERLLARGKTSGRSDDNTETIRKRFKTFLEQSLPVITHYEGLGKAVRISSVPAPEAVFEEVVKVLNPLHPEHAAADAAAAAAAKEQWAAAVAAKQAEEEAAAAAAAAKQAEEEAAAAAAAAKQAEEEAAAAAAAAKQAEEEAAAAAAAAKQAEEEAAAAAPAEAVEPVEAAPEAESQPAAEEEAVVAAEPELAMA